MPSIACGWRCPLRRAWLKTCSLSPMPFREAHHVTGSIVALAEKHGTDLNELPLQAMQAVEARITEGVFSVLSVENSVSSRTSYGGPAPHNVHKMAAKWVGELEIELKNV